jgi:exonuclease III
VGGGSWSSPCGPEIGDDGQQVPDAVDTLHLRVAPHQCVLHGDGMGLSRDAATRTCSASSSRNVDTGADASASDGGCPHPPNVDIKAHAGRVPPSPGATRFGEADHPGPTASAPARVEPPAAARPLLRHELRPERVALQYPRPRRGGVEHFVAPGFVAQDNGQGQDDFRLRVESANTTGIKSLKRRLRDSESHVLLAQETRAMDDRCVALSAWALRRGWKSLWAPAAKGKGGGPSAGVAVFVRSHLGLRHPQTAGYVWHPSRAVAGIVEAPGHRPLIVASVYLHHGLGPVAENLRIMDDVARALAAQEGEWNSVIGGDFNMDPHALADCGIDREMGSSIVTPDTARGTFRTSTANSLIDYYLVSDRLAAAVETCRH